MIGADHEWRFFEGPAEPIGPGHEGVLGLEVRAQDTGIVCQRLTSIDGSSAIVLSSRAFHEFFADLAEARTDATQAIVDASDELAVVCISAHLERRSLEALIAFLGQTLGCPFDVATVGQEAIPATSASLAALEQIGARLLGRGRAPTDRSGGQLEFGLFAVPENAKSTTEALLAGAPTKIGEGPDNLDGRAKWFKRSLG